jgi:hypothetical protein
MGKHRVTYCGMEGEGSTAKAAREQAQRQLEAAMTDSYSPWAFRDREHTLFVWREPAGWGYRIVWPDSAKGQQLTPNSVPLGEFKSVCGKAAFHFAQSVYPNLASVPEDLGKRLSAQDRQELADYFARRTPSQAEAPEGGVYDLEGVLGPTPG